MTMIDQVLENDVNLIIAELPKSERRHVIAAMHHELDQLLSAPEVMAE